ncbi:MAG: lytic transglycosylase domain-containing protein [Solirubrobacteraceae bacterium]
MTAGSAAARVRGQSVGTGWIAAGAAGLVAIALVLVAALTALGGASLGAGVGRSEIQSDGVSALAEREIPPLYLRLYEQAAQRYGLDWAILAGIGKVECDHGRDPAPSCTQEGAVNSAGAGGPMQFLASTWAQYGVDADGGGRADRWDPADAIYGAANYLRASGAPGDYRRAIFAYNHANWYVADVESWATKYGGAPVTSATTTGQPSLVSEEAGERGEVIEGADLRLQAESATPVRFIAGERAELAPGDGHVALVPAGAPATVQAMVVAGNELQELPYGPGGHPDPLGALEEDCSSTVNYVLYRSGVRPLAEILSENPLAQDYVDWGAPGPGRWVTIYASASPTPHVFIVVAGLRLDTSHDGTDVGPNRYENGPRWRILDHIPTWAHWSVRHPPGL